MATLPTEEAAPENPEEDKPVDYFPEVEEEQGIQPDIAPTETKGLNSVELAKKLGLVKRTVQRWAKDDGKTPATFKPQKGDARKIPAWHVGDDGKWYEG